jgi:iron complex transport system ATP-binding protein
MRWRAWWRGVWSIRIPTTARQHQVGTPSSPLLDVTNATVVRGLVRALDGVTFSVNRGEHTAILGPNGAGKSSLIRLLALDDYPIAVGDPVPRVRWFGRDRWNVGELRRRLGIVSGDLDAGFARASRRGRVSGLDAVTAGFFASHALFAHHVVTDSMRRDAADALGRVESASLGVKMLSEMSAGERRRVLIARALVTRPEALLLDEPTTGLDLVARHRFMESVRRLARDGATVVLVTHHADEIIPEIRRVLLLGRGRLVRDGSPEETLTGESLGALYGAPVSVECTAGYYTVRVDPPPG